MKKWILAAAVAILGLAAGDARAQDPGCANCGHEGGGYVDSGYNNHFSAKPIWTRGYFGGSPHRINKMPTLPVYMAAPWYLYWPYDGHFQTVAPMAHGLYYPPPTYTGNPYMPGGFPGYFPGNPSPAFPVNPAKP